MLTNDEKIRYQRQIQISGFGEESQIKLKQASVLVIGAGGLGSPILLYLAAAGIGHIGIIDNDTIVVSNLQRQILYSSSEVGNSKAETAEKKLLALNPNSKIEVYSFFLNSSNALELFANYDLIIDGSDNFPTRYLVNDACVLLNKPFVSGAIFQYEGQVAVFNYKSSASYRDLFPEPPPKELAPNCAEAGVIGSIAGIIGSVQATEAIKIITEIGEVLCNKLLIIDALSMQFRKIRISKNPDLKPISELIDYELFCSSKSNVEEIDFEQLCEFLTLPGYVLIDVRSPFEHESENIGGISIPLDKIIPDLDIFKMNNKKIFLCCEVVLYI